MRTCRWFILVLCVVFAIAVVEALLASAAEAADPEAGVQTVSVVGDRAERTLSIDRPRPETEGVIKLPIGSITPKGWLRKQLELEAAGLTGRLAEISPWLKVEKNGWVNPNGKDNSGWEELPYWLRATAIWATC